MQLTLDTDNNQYLFRSYEPGKALLIDGTFITTNFIIAPDRLINPWQIKSWSLLALEDLNCIFELNPEVVLLGSGEQLNFPEQKLLAAFYARQIGVEVMSNSAACRTYNVLIAEGRRVIAALFLNNC